MFSFNDEVLLKMTLRDIEMQVAGRMVEYEGLSLVTVRGAGHLVPLNRPSEALALFHSFLTGEQLPTHP